MFSFAWNYQSDFFVDFKPTWHKMRLVDPNTPAAYNTRMTTFKRSNELLHLCTWMNWHSPDSGSPRQKKVCLTTDFIMWPKYHLTIGRPCIDYFLSRRLSICSDLYWNEARVWYDNYILIKLLFIMEITLHSPLLWWFPIFLSVFEYDEGITHNNDQVRSNHANSS